MISSSIKLGLLSLFSSALARPHGYSFGHHHHHHGTGAPHGTGLPHESGAPYGMGNGTSIFGPTGTAGTDILSTITSQVFETQHLTQTVISTVTMSPVPVTEASTGAGAGTETTSALGGDETACGGEVTVTVTNQVTVTYSTSKESSSVAPIETPTPVYPSESSSSKVSPVETTTSSIVFSIASQSSSLTATIAEVTTTSLAINNNRHSNSVHRGTKTRSRASTTVPVPTSTNTPVSYSMTSSSSSPVSAVIAPSSSSKAVATSAATTPVVASGSSGSRRCSVPNYKTVSSKRGLAYNDVNLANLFAGTAVSWAWNWASSASGLDDSISYVPSMWGLRSMDTSGWNSAAQGDIDAGLNTFMGFNEPDMSRCTTCSDKQSDLTIDEAVQGWKTYIEPFACKARLGSPSVTSGTTDGMGLTYLEDFLGACNDCSIDFIVVHWYGPPTALSYFKEHVTNANKISKKPIWVTEFGMDSANYAEDDVIAFMKDAMAFLEDADYVERYAWFMAAEGATNLCTSGALNNIGKAYIA